MRKHFCKHKLHENIRVNNGERSENFKEWLLAIGEGKTKNKLEKENDLFKIPEEMMTKHNIVINLWNQTNPYMTK